MCRFDADSDACTHCACFGDCLDEVEPMLYVPPTPRTDAPMRVIGDRCQSHRHHDWSRMAVAR